MKRSRRVVLTMMVTAAVGAVSMGFTRQRPCGPGLETVPGPGGGVDCRATYHTTFGGFGGGFHAHGHGNAGG